MTTTTTVNATRLPVLYKMDNKGKIRSWTIEFAGNQYRAISGILGGKQTEAKWTTVTEAKSQPTVEKQAEFEARAAWQHKLDRDYYDNLDDAKSGIPKMFEPMLAEKWEALTDADKKAIFAKGNVHMQPKLDGIRCVIRIDKGVLVAKSRENQDFHSVQHILDVVKPFFDKHPTATLDGELYNHDFKSDFQSLSGIIRDGCTDPADLARAKELIQYHIYDVCTEGSTVWDRLAIIRDFWSEGYLPNELRFVATTSCTSSSQFDAYQGVCVELGYEGTMLRLPGGYENKRSDNLLKRKDFITEEFSVKRIEEGNGNWSGAAKRIVIHLPGAPDDECGCGTRGSFNTQAEILRDKARYETELSTVTVRHFGRTNDNSLRFPVVVAYWPNGRDM